MADAAKVRTVLCQGERSFMYQLLLVLIHMSIIPGLGQRCVAVK